MVGFKQPGDSKPTAAQQSAMDHIGRCFHSLGPPPADFDREGALSELLAKASIYNDEYTPTRPYAKEAVSWPAVGSAPTPVSGLLPQADQEWFGDWERHLLRAPGEAAAVRASLGLRRLHCDATLFGKPAVYADFLWRLHQSGMVRWTHAHGRKGELGIFFVEKKGGL